MLPWAQARVLAPGHDALSSLLHTQPPELFRAGSAEQRSRRTAPTLRRPGAPAPHAPVQRCRATAAPLLRHHGGRTAPPDPRRTPARRVRRRYPSPAPAAAVSQVTVTRSRPSRRRQQAHPVPEKSASAAISALHTRITQERRRRSRPGSTCLRRRCCPASLSLMVQERAARSRGGTLAASHDGPFAGWRHSHPRPSGCPPPRSSAGAPGPLGRRGAGAGGRSSPARGRDRSAAASRRGGKGSGPSRSTGRRVAAAAGEPERAARKERDFSAAPCLALPSTHIVRAGLTQTRLHLARPPPALSTPLRAVRGPGTSLSEKRHDSPSRPLRRALCLTYFSSSFLLGNCWRTVMELHSSPDLLVFLPRQVQDAIIPCPRQRSFSAFPLSDVIAPHARPCKTYCSSSAPSLTGLREKSS